MQHVSHPKIIASAFIEATPAGSLGLAATNKGLCQLFFCSRLDYEATATGNPQAGEKASGIIQDARRQIADYFDGKRREFDLPLDLTGQTPFRLKVLQACAGIPFGQVLTYGELAAKASSPKAARAVGGAMAHNPIALIIPCHRVVGSDRGLHGFSSPGGLETKAILLRHEGVLVEKGRITKG